VKSSTDRTTRLTRFLKALPTAEPVVFPDADDPVAVLVQSWLLWETTTARALGAYEALRRKFVDFNDLRTSMSDEIAEALPSRYPGAVERAERMRASLRSIYLREHAVSLESIRDQGKRDARRYVESLEGIVPFVAARLVLLSFGTHVIPVDGALLVKLREEDVVEETATQADASGVLTRAVKAGDGEAVHASLQAWVEAGGSAPAKVSRRAPAANASKSAAASGRTPARKGAERPRKRNKAGETG